MCSRALSISLPCAHVGACSQECRQRVPSIAPVCKKGGGGQRGLGHFEDSQDASAVNAGNAVKECAHAAKSDVNAVKECRQSTRPPTRLKQDKSGGENETRLKQDTRHKQDSRQKADTSDRRGSRRQDSRRPDSRTRQRQTGLKNKTRATHRTRSRRSRRDKDKRR